jgi:hypothetical protein
MEADVVLLRFGVEAAAKNLRKPDGSQRCLVSRSLTEKIEEKPLESSLTC